MEELLIKQTGDSAFPNEGSFLQTPFWAEFKSRHGWSYRRFLIGQDECAVLTRNFCKGFFTLCYIPLFPVFKKTESAENISRKLYEAASGIKKFLPKNTLAVRFDPAIEFDSPEERDSFNKEIKKTELFRKGKIKKNSVDIQPPDSTQVDLTLSEDQMLSKMHSKWRYNIRLSEKKGVQIKKYDGRSPDLSEKIDKFYELTKETNARDGNSSHAKSYYKDLLEYSAAQIGEGKDCPVVNLYIAEHEGDEIASIITLFSKTESIYLYGASSNRKRNLMPNYLLQWTAMKDAKAYGSKYYDMYGLPPEGKDEKHPMHGLYMFKSNFGGKMIHRPGSFDVPLSFLYNAYSLAESLRSFWFKVIMKKLRGR